MQFRIVPKLHLPSRIYLIIACLIAVVGIVSLAGPGLAGHLWSARSFAGKAAQTALPPLAAKQKSAYVNRSRLWPQLCLALDALGNRLEKPGRERLILNGTLSRPNIAKGAPSPVHVILEAPDRLRLEQQNGSQLQVTVFDGSVNTEAVKSDGTLTAQDQSDVETLAFDTTDHFFVGRMQGQATRFLGPRFRLDDGKAEPYAGPYYDVYQMVDRITVTKESRPQPKFYFFNSETQLLERVRYEIDRGGRMVRVEVQYSSWQKISGQQLPGKITRLEDDSPVLALTLASVAIGPALPDNIFNRF